MGRGAPAEAERAQCHLGHRRQDARRAGSEAGVGKGTIFHRFGSRTGLMRTLVGSLLGAPGEQAAGAGGGEGGAGIR